ncbi:MAG: YdbH domain-containing protein [Candidatus Andeanibacterium colombiense]|uniref:YdbH domain-containing protein n=1 Tax=Candidatus Andeanibacterium colombiense TaxID=3121345 RepID=A0AAJ5X9Z8_9SPHN|nr:MAG: YdbH domain-containing protein [Sphingomonadaceae bacterium]
MAEQIDEASNPAPRRRFARRLLAVLALLLCAALAWAWLSRERLAADFITAQLAKLGLEASYKVESIGPRREVLTDIVVGDPKHPDLTIERIEVAIEPRWPLVGISSIRAVRPRLYGSYRKGKLSFGALDKVLFGGTSKEPFRLPDMDAEIDDARALIDSDYGAIGIKVQGSGNLRSGFKGILAATAPKLALAGCAAGGATLYGAIGIDNVQPGFKGPLRLQSLACANGLALNQAGIQLDLKLDRDFKGFEGEGGLKAGALAYGDNRAAGFGGTTRIAWRKGGLTAGYDLALERIATPQLALDRLGLKGQARIRQGSEIQADIAGSGLRPGPGLDRALGSYARSASGTLLGPMLAQIRTALAREGKGSSLAAGLTLRKTGQVLSLVMPEGRLRGSGGDTLLAVSGLQLSGSGAGPARFAGNFSTGGAGLPRIAGRMERGANNELLLRMRMAEYRAGRSSLELPELVVAQAPGGALGFSGRARASGAVPGGDARGLAVPINGSWSRSAGLTLWKRCTAIAFDRLTLSSLTLDRRSLTLCPPTGSAIVRSDARGTRIAAGAPSLELSGRLGETPLRLKTGAVGLAWPGSLVAKDIDVGLGAVDAPTQFRIAAIDAKIANDIAGHFSGTDVLLYAVPLDVLGAQGNWRYVDGRLELTGGAFTLRDRQQPGRFEPLAARDAVLTLADNRIAATAELREPKSDRLIVKADIAHDLGNAAGHADLTIPGILFDGALQPATLSGLALGVVADAKGTVSGSGRIDWNANAVTSHGSFTTDKFDFAAAFGPVEGVAGTIEFTDLLGMVTAPNQHITIESFNPGIAVDRGELRFQLEPGYRMVVLGGSWPFVGGTLELQPTATVLTAPEERRFVLKLIGVDAAQFLQRMGLANLSATGIFDGSVPLVFDQNGGRIDNGVLTARPPGGNIAYVGALTYEDMNPMANYAFDMLKSLDYRSMEIQLGGSLSGEIVTRVRFDGIRQGEGTKQNFITRRLAKLPIRFNVNIRAPFYQLIGNLKSMYDPAYVRDPKTLGLLDANGKIIEHPVLAPLPAIKPEDLPEADGHIQPRESEPMP